jgi:Ser/Thr protein kinase RdoA (MazF antagonist)
MERANPTDLHFEAIRPHWGLDSHWRLIRRVENFVYEGSIDGRAVILRFTEPTHRTESELVAELTWMNHLHSHGVSVARPIPTQDGKWIASAEIGESHFFVSVFEKASGDHPRNSEITPAFMRLWGETVGRLHSLPAPPECAGARALWFEDAGFRVAEAGVREKDELPTRRFRELVAWLKSLPNDQHSFGLIHADLQHGNLFLDQRRITLIDFDDCCRHFFAYDLMVPLMNIQRMSEMGRFDASFEKLLESYLEGYFETHDLAQEWRRRLETFLLYRQVTIYHWARAQRDAGQFDENGLDWAAKIMPWCLEKMQVEPDLS